MDQRLKSLIREHLESLPKCSFCKLPATRAYERGSLRYCDVHGDDDYEETVPEYPRAKTVRELMELIEWKTK